LPSDTFERGWLERTLGLRPGERATALSLMVTGALLMAGQIIGKSIRETLFLSTYPAEMLPYVLLSVAILAAPVVSVYTHAANRIPFRLLAPGFYMFVAVGFMAMERLYSVVQGWPAFVLYIYVSLLSLFAVSQYWLLVAWRFNTREARRLMWVLNSGNVIGGLVGGLIARSLSYRVNPEAMLWIVAGLYASAGLASDWVARKHTDTPVPLPSSQSQQAGIVSGLQQVARHQLLRGAVVLVLISTLISTLVDYQLKHTAQQTFQNKGELIHFFGGFYAVVNAVTLVLQIGITPYALRRWGVAGSLMVLPLGLLPGTMGMALLPGILMAALLRGSEQSIRNSSWRSGFELIFLPLSPELRRQTKMLIDVFIERCSDGVAGLVLILLLTAFHLDPWGLTWVILGLSLLLAAVVLRLRNAYVSTLEKNLSFAVNTFLTDTPVVDQASLHTLEIPPLPAQDSRLLQSLEVSGRLGSMKDMPLELLKHPSPPIRERAMSLLEAFGAGKPPSAYEIEQLRRDALAARENGVSPLVAVPAPPGKGPATPALGPDALFARLVEARGRDVIDALAQVERSGDVRLAPAILPLLEDRRLRERSEAVLRRFGPAISGLLGDVLLQEEASVRLRRHVARLMGEMDSPLAEFSLKQALLARSGEVRRAASTALYRMRQRSFSRGLSVEELHELLEPEVHRNRSVWEADTELQRNPQGSASASRDALALSVRETKSRTLRHVFRLLGLCFPPDATQAAYRGLTAGSAQVRDQALEYLDNVLPEKLRQLVWPLIDPEARWGHRPKQRDLEAIMVDLLRSGVTIDLPREALDLSLEPSNEE
jgi:HEAT repeat protein